MASNLTSADSIFNTTNMMPNDYEEVVEDFGTKLSQNTYYNMYNKGDTVNYSQIMRYENVGANTLDIVTPFKIGTLKSNLRMSDKTTLIGTYNQFAVYAGPLGITVPTSLGTVRLYADSTLIYEEINPTNVNTFSIDISSFGTTGYLAMDLVLDYGTLTPDPSPGTFSCMAGISYFNMRTI